jgi:hypothetical protein
MAQMVTVLNYNKEGPRSNLSLDLPILTDIFHCFSQSFHVNARIAC